MVEKEEEEEEGGAFAVRAAAARGRLVNQRLWNELPTRIVAMWFLSVVVTRLQRERCLPPPGSIEAPQPRPRQPGP
jgi:hypothetical protein